MYESTIETAIGSLKVVTTGVGPEVIFLHGLMTNGAIWNKVTQELPGFQCIRVDLPLGAHRIPAESDADLSIPSIANAIASALMELCPEGYWLVGSDTGGVLAQQLVCYKPEGIRGLLLLPCDLYDNFLPLPLRYLQYLARIPGAMWATRWALEIPLIRKAPIAFGWLARRELAPGLVRQSIDPLRSGLIRRDLAKFLRGIDPAITLATAAKLPTTAVSTHFLWATDDRLFPVLKARQLAESMPEGTYWREVSDAYSFIQIDRPQAVVDAVQRLAG